MLTLDEILDLYQNQGQKPYGETVTQTEHALQVAQIAEQQGANETLIAAALLHDVGHLFYHEIMERSLINDRHETIGSHLLAQFFSEEISEPVKLHVKAKRYLCAVDPEYYKDLSEASKQSLELQGGRFHKKHQVQKFESNPFHEDAIQLRLWDDQGKVPKQQTASLDHYRPLLESLHQSFLKSL